MYLLCTCYVLKDPFSLRFCFNIQLIQHCMFDRTPCQPWPCIAKIAKVKWSRRALTRIGCLDSLLTRIGAPDSHLTQTGSPDSRPTRIVLLPALTRIVQLPALGRTIIDPCPSAATRTDWLGRVQLPALAICYLHWLPALWLSALTRISVVDRRWTVAFFFNAVSACGQSMTRKSLSV